MFSKFFKYEFKSVSKFGVPLLIAAILLGVLLDVSIVLLFLPLVMQIPDQLMIVMSIMGSIVLMVSILALVAISVVALVLLLKRYYDSTVTAEGYLTFTLPVTQSDIFLAKFLNAWIWSIFFGVVVIIDFIGVILTLTAVGNIPWPDWGQLFQEIIAEFESLGILSIFEPWQWTSFIVCGVLIMLLAEPLSLMLWFTIITIASILVKKNRILVMIVLFYGWSFVSGIVMSVFQTILMLSGNPALLTIVFEWLYLVAIIGLLIGGYFLNKHLLIKKLNLE
ncbi:MAG: hypothetical protein J6D37_02500 [Clostridia bacterium]|nr:hypothetical protein [Clostridia bacterium]